MGWASLENPEALLRGQSRPSLWFFPEGSKSPLNKETVEFLEQLGGSERRGRLHSPGGDHICRSNPRPAVKPTLGLSTSRPQLKLWKMETREGLTEAETFSRAGMSWHPGYCLLAGRPWLSMALIPQSVKWVLAETIS